MEVLRYTKSKAFKLYFFRFDQMFVQEACEFPDEYPTFRHARTDVVTLFIMREIKCFEYVECIKLK